MPDPIISFHEEQMKKMNFPEWLKEIKCPFCKKTLPLRSIRNIQLCLNTRNFGDVAIEVFCDDCRKMDTLYFRAKIVTFVDFIDHIQESDRMPENSIVEEQMYKMNYNNILELMAKTKNEENHDII